MLKHAFLWMLMLRCLGVGAQPQEARLLFQTREEILDLEADHLGNLYLLHRDRLVKTDGSGQELARFSRPDLGVPDRINVYDPMRILLFYPGFNQLIILDNQLNPIVPPISLFDWGLVDVPCAAIADENNLWLYDQVADRLLKMDVRDGRQLFSTPPLTQLIGQENQPLRLRTNVRGLLVLMEEGIARFDAMGNFSVFSPLPHVPEDLHLRDQSYTLSMQQTIMTEEGQGLHHLEEQAHWTDDGERLYWTEGKAVWCKIY